MGAREDLGVDLARAQAGSTPQTVSAEVVDTTDAGVNLNMNGALLLDVPCPDTYRDRAAGDWVAVRPGTRPVVLWRLGPDPAADETERIQAAAEAALDDMQVVRAATWGTAAPSGSGWQQATIPWIRKTSAGKIELYFQLGSQSDTSPSAPATRPPKTLTVSPTDSGTWRNSRPDEYASSPTQGDWTGRGNRRGAWFYGSRIVDACQGKTVASMKVSFTRKRGSGHNAKRPMHLYLHDHNSAPSGQLDLDDGPENLLSLSVGGTGTATLPSSWRTKLANGTARGLAIYANGSTDYASFTGGKITISFSA